MQYDIIELNGMKWQRIKMKYNRMLNMNYTLEQNGMKQNENILFFMV